MATSRRSTPVPGQRTLWLGAFLASPTRRRAGGAGATTRATFGPSSRAWSMLYARAGSSVRTSLESALRLLTSCSATWKLSATPAGRSWWRLKIAARPTGARACGSSDSTWPTPTASLADKGVRTIEGGLIEAMRSRGPDLAAVVAASASKMWPTPTASMHNDGEPPEAWLARRELLKEKGTNGNGAGMPLAVAVKLWPSPASRDWRDDGASPSAQDRKSPCLPAAVVLAKNWPTPHGQCGPEDRPTGPSANELGAAVLRNWPTPMANDTENAGYQRSGDRTYLTLPGVQADSGPPVQDSSNGGGRNPSSSLSTDSSSRKWLANTRPGLNPRWELQLMGYPADWLDGVDPA